MSKGSWLVVVILVVSFIYRDPLMVKLGEMKQDLGFGKETEQVAGVITDKQRTAQHTTRISHTLVVNGTNYIVKQGIYESLFIGDRITLYMKGEEIIEVRKAE